MKRKKETKKFTLELPIELYEQVKWSAADNDVCIRDFILGAIRHILEDVLDDENREVD